MSTMLNLYTRQTLQPFFSVRPGEQRIGQAIAVADNSLDLPDLLVQAKADGCRFVLLGIPEDIGPRANMGLGGADKGWSAFLNRFLNLQANAFITPAEILLLGHIECADLQSQASALNVNDPTQLEQMRKLVSNLDERVTDVAQAVFAANLYPIIIGGGHNNCYPLLKALSQHTARKVNSANLDPHADFRPLEGRHSGNGFSYASQDRYLEHYFVLGLHELKNSAQTLQQLEKAGAEYCSYQRIFVRQERSFQQALELCIEKVILGEGEIAIELDTDSISLMPVSAFTNCGVTVQAAEQFVYQLAKLPRSRYLHLAEAAPAQHPAGSAAGLNEAGQILAALVFAFIQGKQHQAVAI